MLRSYNGNAGPLLPDPESNADMTYRILRALWTLWFLVGIVGSLAALSAALFSGATARRTLLRVLHAWTWPLFLLSRGGREQLTHSLGVNLWRS